MSTTTLEDDEVSVDGDFTADFHTANISTEELADTCTDEVSVKLRLCGFFFTETDEVVFLELFFDFGPCFGELPEGVSILSLRSVGHWIGHLVFVK